jgi:hypothetical protein
MATNMVNFKPNYAVGVVGKQNFSIMPIMLSK